MLVANSIAPVGRSSGGGGAAVVTHTSAVSSNGGTSVTTTGIDTTGASLLVAVVATFNGLDTVTDSKSNTWVALTASPTATAARCQIFYVKAPTVGTAHTCTVSAGAANFPGVAFLAFSGTDTTQIADQQNAAVTSTGVTSQQPGSITPSVNNELVVCGVTLDGAVTGLGVDSGMTVLENAAYSASNGEGVAVAYIVQGTATAINPTWSWTTAHDAASAIASFKSIPPVVTPGAGVGAVTAQSLARAATI